MAAVRDLALPGSRALPYRILNEGEPAMPLDDSGKHPRHRREGQDHPTQPQGPTGTCTGPCIPGDEAPPRPLMNCRFTKGTFQRLFREKRGHFSVGLPGLSRWMCRQLSTRLGLRNGGLFSGRDPRQPAQHDACLRELKGGWNHIAGPRNGCTRDTRDQEANNLQPWDICWNSLNICRILPFTLNRLLKTVPILPCFHQTEGIDGHCCELS